jgi:hypothetical protein
VLNYIYNLNFLVSNKQLRFTKAKKKQHQIYIIENPGRVIWATKDAKSHIIDITLHDILSLRTLLAARILDGEIVLLTNKSHVIRLQLDCLKK